MNLGAENEQVEFKKSTSEMKEGMASIASILNKHDEGTLYFGVRNDGDVCGQDVSESTLREVSQAVGNYIEPSIYPRITHEVSPDGKSYVKVEFSGDMAPYACAGKYRIRVADEDVLMRPEELRTRFKELGDRLDPWDMRVSSKTVSDIDEDALRKFVERGREKDRIKFEYTSAEDALERLGLLDGDYLLNAGAALFCPSKLHDLKMALMGSHARTDILDLQHEAGTVFDLVDKAQWFVTSNTRSRVDTFTPGPSPVYPEIPKDAVREALMNAYAHRLWEEGDAVMVEIFNDAVEITSPGWFIDGQDPEDHLSGKSSSPKTRNRLIAQTLYKSGDIESQGTGIMRIKDLCDKEGIRVEYVRTPDGTKLIFHRNEPFGRSFVMGEKADTTSDVVVNDGVNVVVNGGVNAYIGMSANERSAILAIRETPSITARELGLKIGVSDRTAQRIFRSLREKGFIKRQGSDKTGLWIVIANDK